MLFRSSGSLFVNFSLLLRPLFETRVHTLQPILQLDIHPDYILITLSFSLLQFLHLTFFYVVTRLNCIILIAFRVFIFCVHIVPVATSATQAAMIIPHPPCTNRQFYSLHNTYRTFLSHCAILPNSYCFSGWRYSNINVMSMARSNIN